MPFYCKNCKKHTGNMFPKKLVLILKNKIQGKSKRANCLAETAFFDKINNKYDLEQLLKHFFFFTDACYKRTWRLIV